MAGRGSAAGRCEQQCETSDLGAGTPLHCKSLTAITVRVPCKHREHVGFCRGRSGFVMGLEGGAVDLNGNDAR